MASPQPHHPPSTGRYLIETRAVLCSSMVLAGTDVKLFGTVNVDWQLEHKI